MSRNELKFCEESKRIGRILKMIRVDRCLTQEKLGAILGVSFQQVQKYETGANRISLITAIKICKLLKVDITIFFPETFKEETLEIISMFQALNQQQRITASKIIKAVSDD